MSILDGADNTNSPGGNAVTDVNALNPLNDSSTSGIAKKTLSAVTGAASTVTAKAASVVKHDRTRAAARRAKHLSRQGFDSARTAATSDTTKKVVRHNGFRAGTVGLVAAAVALVVIKRRR